MLREGVTMKTINETFTDEEHAELTKKKDTKESWHDAILRWAK